MSEKTNNKPKVKIRLDDAATKAIWSCCLQAKEEVASWPAWKRGTQSPDHLN